MEITLVSDITLDKTYGDLFDAVLSSIRQVTVARERGADAYETAIAGHDEATIAFESYLKVWHNTAINAAYQTGKGND